MTVVEASVRSARRFSLATAANNKWAVAAALGILATAVAAAGSWIPSLWGDEVASLMSSQRSLPSLFPMLGHVDAVHGAYYVGLHGWIHLFGTSPFSLRFPSAIAVGFAVAATVAVAWRLGDRRVAIIAGLVCVILPRVTYMGEEARSYAFSAAIAAWLTFVFVEVLARPQARRLWWVAYGVLLTIGTYVFLYVSLFVVVHAVLLLVTRPGRRIVVPWAITVGAAVVACAPLGIVAFLERRQIAYLAATDQLTFNTVFSSLWFSSWTVAVVGWALIVFAIVTQWLRRRRVGGAGIDAGISGGSAPLPSLVAAGVAWLAIPSGLLIAAHTLTPDFTARYVSFCAPAAALLIAVGLDRLARLLRWAPVVAGVALVAVVVPVYVGQRTPYAKNGSDWGEVSAVIGAHARAGDGVVFDETIKPSKRPRLAMHAYPAGFAGLVDVGLKIPYTRNKTWYDAAMSVTQADTLHRFDGIQRVWLIDDRVTATKTDSYGLADLERLGYQPTGTTLLTPTTKITELTR